MKSIRGPACRCIVVVLLLAATPFSRALDPERAANHFTTENWGPKEGFPEETILGITQTVDGYLWIATPAGLVRFDGQDFTFFDSERVPGLQLLRVSNVLATADGALWLRNAEGLLWRYAGGEFRRIEGDAQNRIGMVRWVSRDTADRVWIVTDTAAHIWKEGRLQWEVMDLRRWRGRSIQFSLDRRHRLWLRPAAGGLVRLTASGSIEREFPPDARTGFRGPVQSMVEDSSGVIVAATAEGLFRVHGDVVSRIDQGREHFSGNSIRLRIDKHDALWILSDQGLSRFRNGRMDSILPAAGFLGDRGRTTFLDREGSLWVGTDRKGLFRIKDSNFARFGESEGLSSNQVYAVFRDSTGVTWVGTDTGVDSIAPDASVPGAIRHYNRRDGVPEGGIRAVASDTSGRIWIGGDGGLAVLGKTGRFVPKLIGGATPFVRALTASRGGGMWVASASFIVELDGQHERRLPLPPGLNTAAIRLMLDSPRWGLLVAIQAGGLWRCEASGCGLILPPDSNAAFSVYGLHEDSAGALWVVSSRGLARFRPSTDTRSRAEWYQLAPLLTQLETEFYQIVQDRTGLLWLGGRRSLVRMEPVDPELLERKHLRQFDLHDGLRSANFGAARQGFRSVQIGGPFWLPTMVGLVGVVPNGIRENLLPPPVEIQQLSIDGKPLRLSPNLTLPAGAERIEIKFAGLSLLVPAKVRYRYRLDGFDPQWIESVASKRAVYTRLGRGRYKFQVMASNNDGVWNQQGASLDFEILPHFYERAWFLVASAAGLLLTGWLVFRVRTRSLIAQTQALEARVVERTAELERARGEAVAAARAKADFLATMSHEIRTPMNGVLGMVSLLEATSLTKEQRSCTEIISVSGHALMTILNDVLDLSRIEAGKLEILAAPMHPGILGEQVVDLFRGSAAEKGLRLSCCLEPRPDASPMPEWFSADEARVRQILVNLVGNAIKFTDVGSVDLTISARPLPEGKWWLAFRIRDNGIGMSPAQLARLFQKFTQADSSSARKYGGTGLGLAICKRLADLMDGTINVQSAPGLGSTFELGLPVQLAAQPVTKVESTTPSAIGISMPCRILLAEDNPVNVRVAVGLLARAGYSAETVMNGRDAVAAATAEPFDVIFMDCQMPEMDGFEATRQIRQHSGANRPVIIAMTANAMEGDRDRCLAAGMDDYLAKPLVVADLMACLNRWVPVGEEIRIT